jgi:hypothetical protein
MRWPVSDTRWAPHKIPAVTLSVGAAERLPNRLNSASGPLCSPTRALSARSPRPNELIGSRATLTSRAVEWATDALAHDDTTVSALSRHLGVDWHTLRKAIRVEATRRTARPERMDGGAHARRRRGTSGDPLITDGTAR